MPDGSHLPPIAHLTRRQKAALLVQYLMADGQTLNLSEMPEDAQIALTREIADIGMVDRATVDHVVIEFLDEMDRLGLTGPRWYLCRARCAVGATQRGDHSAAQR